MAEIKWNPQPPTPEPTCVCGATNFVEHLQRVIGGYPPHTAEYFIGGAETWVR
ncbi:MAG: hypothetical protein JWO67_4028 [Streptosporangiaceae bacterium]|nr:hypothetical protein [Streptosporangiaceae bacterium]